jgi:3-oxoacyl-[acyl-carrier-protein] synthase II
VKRRVFVTGMGMVTCLGSGVEANWQAAVEGRSGIAPISLFDATAFQTKIAGEVRGRFDPAGHVPEKEVRRMDRCQQLMLVAAGEAMGHSGLTCPPENPFRCGVVVGSGMGGLITIYQTLLSYVAKGPRGVHPLAIPKVVINLAPGMLAIRYGFKGHNFGVVNACTSGTSAIGEAYRLIKEGRAEVMLTGGTEATITELAVAAFNALRALSTRNDEPEKACRPFDLNRDGFVMSEGAASLVLESEEHALRRGASLHAEVVGYGATDDGYHFVMPDPEGQGAYWAMRYALEDADLKPEQIHYINAHGTATELNDAVETAAIKQVFGDHAQKVAISSTKSMTGHMIGAAGAVEAIFTVMALKTGIIPPTINLETPDPSCDLDYTPNKAARRDGQWALSNSFAFGGQNGTLAFARVEDQPK